MATCIKYNKKSILLEVAKNGECVECSEKTAKEMLKNNMSISKIIIQKLDDYPHNSEKNKNCSVDEIRKYKQLLDEGVITEEEFQAKKKQILEI